MQYELWYMQEHGATGSIGLSSSSSDAVGMNPMMLSEMKTAESVQNLNRANADKSRASADLDREKVITEDLVQTGKELE